MKRLLLSQVFIFFCCFLQAQIQVYSNNNIGIGSNTANAASLLSVNCAGSSSYAAMIKLLPTTSGGFSVCNDPSNTLGSVGLVGYMTANTSNNVQLKGVYGFAYCSTPSTTGRTYGVTGIAGNCTNGYNFGLFGQLQGSNNGAAIYAQVGSASHDVMDAQYAGYFKGDVKITTKLWVNGVQITSSDERLKKNIVDLDTTEKIFSLRPVRYNLKNPKEMNDTAMLVSDTGKIEIAEVPNPDYLKKEHFGFLANDLQKVYPELVYESGGMLGIDYQGLIPVIIDQLKKLKQAIDEKDARIISLEQKIKQLQR